MFVVRQYNSNQKQSSTVTVTTKEIANTLIVQFAISKTVMDCEMTGSVRVIDWTFN